MRAITKERLIGELQALGLRLGDTVMMHSSLSSLGYVDGGAEAVVDALQEAVGNEGTLLVPGFRDSAWEGSQTFINTDCRDQCPQPLCPNKQPSIQGILTETIRKRPGCLRSCHPTHSWLALGPAAERLLVGHCNATTPSGAGNPFEQVIELDGCVLMLGVGINTVTLWHYYEETLGVPYQGHYWPDIKHFSNCVPGRRIQYEFPGIMQDVCRAAGILDSGPVGKSISGLMRARAFADFMATTMADDPYCMVLRPPDRNSGELMIDALQKARCMLEAWRRGPAGGPKNLGHAPKPIPPPGPEAMVRTDCPAFAGYHKGGGKRIPLCRANDRHPDLYQHGKIFNTCGVTTCVDCSWHHQFPPTLSSPSDTKQGSIPAP